MSKTFGTLVHEPPKFGNGRGVYVLDAAPHVSLRLKRIFPRVLSSRGGLIRLANTPEIAFELDWVLDRWPMEMDAATADMIQGRKVEYEERLNVVEQILGGYVPPSGLREPARPARDYQLEAAAIMRATKRLLLADDVGAGKTTSAALLLLDPENLPATVVTLTHLPEQLVEEMGKTAPWLKFHIPTTTKPYDPDLLCRPGDQRTDVIVLGYSKIAGWADHLSRTTRTVIFDEAQELRRDGTQKYNSCAQIARSANTVVGLTATPIYNKGGEIHNVLGVIAPDVLGDRAEFLREWGSGDASNITVNNPTALGQYLREEGVMLRRTRKDIGRELPELQRLVQNVELNRKVYDSLTQGAADLATTIVEGTALPFQLMKAAGDLDMQLRHATGVAKAPHVADFASLLLESGEPIVLFGWHRDVYDIWADRLDAYNPAFYTGSETAKHKRMNAQDFLEGRTNLLIMSLRSGAGLDGLQERAHIAVFGELDWSPGVHTQCIGRVHRDGQEEPVVAYFMTAMDGADGTMTEVLNLKRMQSEPMMDPDTPILAEAAPEGDRLKLLAADYLKAHHPAS